MKISEHFTLGELTFSDVAVRRGLDNTPSLAIMRNLARVAAVMEEIRTLLGCRPIVVHSGYRSLDLNTPWVAFRPALIARASLAILFVLRLERQPLSRWRSSSPMSNTTN